MTNTDLHGLIMNLPCRVPENPAVFSDYGHAYGLGHRDARHAAAEVVLSVGSPQVGTNTLETQAVEGAQLVHARAVMQRLVGLLINAANNADECADSVANVHRLASNQMRSLGATLYAVAGVLRDELAPPTTAAAEGGIEAVMGAFPSGTACSVASLPEPEVSALRVPPAGATRHCQRDPCRIHDCDCPSA
jgi:hypothetical protein